MEEGKLLIFFFITGRIKSLIQLLPIVFPGNGKNIVEFRGRDENGKRGMGFR